MRKFSLTHLVIILCLTVFAFSTHSAAQEKDGLLKIYFFDIGQGDAIFIEAPNGNQVLIDGGPDNRVLSELAKAMPFYDRDIDVVVATHPHADHIFGLIEVLDRFEVANIIEAKDRYVSPVFDQWQEKVGKEGARETEALAGKVVDLGNNVFLRILYPFKSYDGTVLKKPHEANVVVMLEYKELEVLLTGDMEMPVERQLLLDGGDISADVLKVGHHGSKTSSSDSFLSSVNPEIAVIQVGKNSYGHPTQEVLSRLEKSGRKYYRTNLDGTIKISSDGESFQIITAK
ncbi:MAG: MBL fold metallo-hydrolase [Candidatus Yanofskybacteria bacterium]|nr:MBL fold metallo-hydrolase [Candidatus Yanofskybacteria bacterium]